jgi:capsule polysaccharide export protein KpsE/RkpR
MSTNKLFAIVLLLLGAGLLYWGFDASDSFASEVSEAVEGTPSEKSIGLMVTGGVIALVGVFLLMRRGH